MHCWGICTVTSVVRRSKALEGSGQLGGQSKRLLSFCSPSHSDSAPFPLNVLGCLRLYLQACFQVSAAFFVSSFSPGADAQLPPSPASRPGDPVDVPAAVPGAGKGRCLEPGVRPCLPPGCPAGSCQCCPGLWLLKAPLLPPTPGGPNPEWQVRTEEGGGIDTRSPKAPSSGGFIHLHSGATGEVPFYPLQTSSDGTLCPNLRAQLCRMWWGQRESQSHHWTQLLREEHIPQTGEDSPCTLGLWHLLHCFHLPPACKPGSLQLLPGVLT